VARRGLWALPLWTILLFLATLTHQPDTRTDFPGFARYVTTNEFLVSHIAASIVGAAIGVVGLLALYVFLALHIRSRLAALALFLAVVGDVMITAIFGMAAFAQPALGRLYLAGQTDAAVSTYDDMYGTPLGLTAAVGILLFVVGVVLLGIVVSRSGVLPRWAGIGLAVGVVVFGLIGVVLADFIQSIGAALLIASTVWIALAAGRWMPATPGEPLA
jgi:hypothetical protein